MTNVTLTADHRDNNPLSRDSSVLRDSVTRDSGGSNTGLRCLAAAGADNFGDNVD